MAAGGFCKSFQGVCRAGICAHQCDFLFWMAGGDGDIFLPSSCLLTRIPSVPVGHLCTGGRCTRLDARNHYPWRVLRCAGMNVEGYILTIFWGGS